MTNSHEVLPGVYEIDTPLGGRLSTLYLIVGRDRSVLFDAGVDGAIPEHVVPFAAALGLPLNAIEMVVISHCDVDHFGGIQDAHDFLPAARVLAHELDADAMEAYDVYEQTRGRSFRTMYGFDEGDDGWARSVVREGRVDRRLTGDERIDLGDRTLHVLHLPGHSRGHLSVLDPANSLIIVGDAILGTAVPFATGEPAFPPTYRHERPYLDSIERVRALQVKTVATAHYGSFHGKQVAGFLDASRAFALDLRERVLEAVHAAASGLDLEELARQLDPEVGAWPKGRSVAALASPIAAHLEQLESEGILRRVIRRQPPRAVFLDTR